jgi:DNA-binding response OmpR family regulator
MAGILLIDAEQPFADQLAGSLKGRGFSVKLLDDGKDGLDYARDNRPDLIILCVELPKMSGYSICNKLKKDNDLKGIPLIITSKEATPETFAQHKKLKTRAEDYLIKPFSDAELVEKIGALNISMPSSSSSMGGGNGASAPAPAKDDAFDALDSLGADLDLGPSSGGESAVKLDDAEFASLDVDSVGSPSGASTAAPGALGLSPEDDALLASLDDLGKAPATASAAPSIDEFDLGPKVEEDPLGGLDFDAVPEKPSAPPPAAAKPPPRPEPQRTQTPMASSADLQQLTTLRRDNTELKAKIAELEARLKSAQDDAKAAKDAAAAAASASGGSSAREVLNLKEQLRTKEKEIGALKDEVFEKEKATVDAQEQTEQIQRDMQSKLDATKGKDVEISTLHAKVKALTEERDELESQVQGRMRQAEAERDEAKSSLDQARSDLAKSKQDLEKAKQVEERLRMDVDRHKVDADDQKKQLAAASTKVKELENEVRTQEDRALKAYQRLKTEETLREKAKKAVEIAFTLLNGDVETGGKSVDLDQLDAE